MLPVLTTPFLVPVSSFTVTRHEGDGKVAPAFSEAIEIYIRLRKCMYVSFGRSNWMKIIVRRSSLGGLVHLVKLNFVLSNVSRLMLRSWRISKKLSVYDTATTKNPLDGGRGELFSRNTPH